jgi:putative spermidine/putrescine transport system ATP-binding protein
VEDFTSFVIKDVTKEFDGKTALTRFSLSISRGEFVTFLGPSGCGKSTALNCVAGLLPISSGEISIDGEPIDDGKRKVAAEKRGFGLVFQNYALFPHLSVFGNVAFGLRIRKMPKAVVSDKVRAALKLVHLEGHEGKFPAQLSGGEQQRVAIARCIVLEPRLLMLDEPLSNLDAKLRVEMRNELLSLHNRLKVTTIYVTHDQQEALALSDRIVVMRLGRIQQVGTPQQVYSDPANLFVADFMGFKNIWDGELESVQERADGLDAQVAVAGMRLRARLPYPVGDPRRDALLTTSRADKKVVTAIRPEDITVGKAADGSCVRAKVALVEYQGQASFVTACADNGTIIELRPSMPVRISDMLDLAIAPDKIFVFAGSKE